MYFMPVYAPIAESETTVESPGARDRDGASPFKVSRFLFTDTRPEQIRQESWTASNNAIITVLGFHAWGKAPLQTSGNYSRIDHDHIFKFRANDVNSKCATNIFNDKMNFGQ